MTSVPPPPSLPASPVFSRPYAPSWLEWFIARIKRLPFPVWVSFIGLGIVVFALVTAIKWLDGAYPVGTFYPTHAALAAVAVAILGVTHAIDDVGKRALRDMRPALIVDQHEYQLLAYQLTTIPARPGLLASLIGVAVLIVWLLYDGPTGLFRNLKFFTSSLATVVDGLLLGFVFAGLGVAVYASLNMLRLMSHIYAHYVQIDLFHPIPIYAFSRVSAFLALSITFTEYLWLAASPSVLSSLSGLAFAILVPVLGGIVFVVPLLGIHRELVDEKARRKAAIAYCMDEAILKLQRHVRSNQLADLSAIHTTIQALNLAEQRLDRIPTWPWHPDTPRLVVPALLMPFLLWLIQRLLGRFVGS